MHSVKVVFSFAFYSSLRLYLGTLYPRYAYEVIPMALKCTYVHDKAPTATAQIRPAQEPTSASFLPSRPCHSPLFLETVKDNVILVTNFLIDQKLHNIRSLIPAQLNNLTALLILLHCAIAREILLEGLADALNVKVVGKTGDGRDTLASVALLDSNVDLFGGCLTTGVLGRVLEGVKGVELHGWLRLAAISSGAVIWYARFDEVDLDLVTERCCSWRHRQVVSIDGDRG